MKTLRELRAVEINQDAEEFGALAKFILKHGGRISEAAAAVERGGLANSRGLTMRTRDILKAYGGGREISRTMLQKTAQGASGLAGSAFQDLGVISAGFVNSLASAGAFDRMLADGAMAEIPLQSGTVGAVTISAVGYQINEAQMKPISRLSVSGATTTPVKAHCAVIVSQELARSPLLAAGQLIQRELRNSCAVATDAAFIASIIAGVIPATSFGNTGNAVRSDLEWLLRQVQLKQTSKPYLVTTSAIAGTLSQTNSTGEAAFPELGPMGGSISGIPVLVSDAVPVGYLILVDASRIAAAGGEVILSQIDEATLQFDDAPSSPPTAATNVQSMWQANLTGIRVERYLIAQKLTTSAVAIINNPNSYISGSGSP